jgi:hypothetical protein
MHLGRGAPVPVLPGASRDSRRPARMRQGNPQVRETGGSGPIAPGLHPSDKPCLMSHAGSQSGGSFMPGAPSCQILENRSFSGTQVFSKKRVFSGNRSLQPGPLPGLSQVLPHRPSNFVLRHSVFCIGPCSPLACSQKSPMKRKDQKRKQQFHILGSKRAEKKEFHDDKLQMNNRWGKRPAQRRSAGEWPERWGPERWGPERWGGEMLGRRDTGESRCQSARPLKWKSQNRSFSQAPSRFSQAPSRNPGRGRTGFVPEMLSLQCYLCELWQMQEFR